MRKQLWRSFKTYSRPCIWSVKEPDSASRILICAGLVCSGAVSRSRKDPSQCSSSTIMQTWWKYTWQEWLICLFVYSFIYSWVIVCVCVCACACVCAFLGNHFHLFASDVDIICASLVLLPREQSSSDLIQLCT